MKQPKGHFRRTGVESKLPIVHHWTNKLSFSFVRNIQPFACLKNVHENLTTNQKSNALIGSGMAIPHEVLAYGWIPFTVVVVVSLSLLKVHCFGHMTSASFCIEICNI